MVNELETRRFTMEKGHFGRVIAKMVLAVVMMAGLTACGGATFVKGSDPLKGGEKVGVLVASYQINSSYGGMHGTHISDKVDAEASVKMGDALKEDLVKKGFTPVMIPATVKTAELVKKYKELPRNFRRVVSDPNAADLGDLHDLFKENGIDRLLLFEGESTVAPSMTQNLTKAAVATGMSIAIGSVVSGGHTKPATFTYTSVVEPNGKLSFYNREQYTKNGDFYYYTDREKMAEHAVAGWIDSTK